jgi:hypothetical protein
MTHGDECQPWRRRCRVFDILLLDRLEHNDFPVKETFHKVLKFNKFLKHLSFKFQGIDSRELAKIINKANIILFSTRGFENITPDIRENKFKGVT